MASTTSFKQQCPSCEAMVPIRDPGLIGRKIDCPKCKYRFVVEKPKGKPKDDDEDEASSDTPAPSKKPKKANGVQPSSEARAPGKKGKPGASDKVAAGKPKARTGPRRRDEDEEEEERPRKKKGGVSTTVILGAGLGGLALVLLIVGGFMLFGGGGSSSSPSKPGGAAPGGSGMPVAQNPGPGVTPGAGENKPSSGSFIADVTNLLPNDAETVVNYQIDKLHDSGLGQAALAPGAFSEKAFNDTFSFPLYADGGKGVERVVTAVNNTNHWMFTVLHAQKGLTIDKDKLIASLQLEAHDPVNGMVAYSVKRDLDALGTLLIKANRPHDDLQVVLLDGQTLVFADPAPMKKFLDDKGHPTLKSQPTQAEPAANPNQGPTPPSPGGSMTPPGSSGSMRPPSASSSGAPPSAGSSGGMRPGPGGSMTPPGGSMMPPGGSMTPPGGSGQAPAKTSAPAQLVGSYLTIDPGMKALFDRIEKSDSAILISAVVPAKDPLVEDFGRLLQGRAASWETSKDTPSDDATRSFLDKVKVFRPQDVGVNWYGVGVSAFSSDKIAGLVALDAGSDLLAKSVVTVSQPAISSLNRLLNGSSTPPNDNGPPGMGPMFPPPGGSGSFPRPGGSGGFPPPGGSGGFPPPGASSGPPPGATFPRPGGSGGFPRPGGSGAPDVPPMPGVNGSYGQNGNPADPNQGQGPLTLTQDRSLILLGGDLVFGGEKEKATVDQEIGQLITRLRAGSEMASSHSHVHELAAALQQYVQKNGHFPRGTVIRERTPERFVDWAPDQRVSWMADLLPYLGDGEYANLKRQIDGAHASWQEGPNLRAAGMMIPQFISHSDSSAAPLVRYPGVPLDVAVTNYVGVAGRGLDAADYPAGDPRDGIFGYDRETKPADVKDGLDKTIALLQIPAGKTPWLAGGGATVRGVSDGPDALTPFVCADYQGRHGTFAVMGDGRVRFITIDKDKPENIDLNKFLAMCTIAGGENLDDIDKIAPVVPDDNPAAPPAVAPPAMGPDAPEAAKPDASKGWTDYTSKEGGYTIQLPPLKFQNVDLPIKTPVGEISTHMYMAQLPNNAGVVIVSYADAPAAPPPDKVDATLDASVVGEVGSVPGGKLTDQKKVTIDGNPGRDVTADAGANGRMKARVLLVKNRIYQLVVGGSPDAFSDKDIQKMFDSFKLTAK